jgi:DNA polymerase-3 subunit gamma/tau
MAYVALYRKYRSQSFSELMGQEQVTRTLQNAIKTKRTAHAYLFHGARGCGKTSTARLMARALNCIAQDSPSPEPCGVCSLCVAIREGTCLDVVEIDAASKTGIDDVREQIIENVQYAPAEARYKVYIIDEVHDLSAKAFDALLKTLEEPPGHVVFILATTEWLKVPITIRSRCQAFQFKRGSLQDLSAAIQRVITAEGYTADPEAVLSIARSAEGSWRDALSLLEQVIAYSDGTITTTLVHRAIGTVGTERIEQIIEAIASADWSRVLAVAAEMMETGTDVRQLLTSLSGYLRDLLILASGAKQAAEKEFGTERLTRLTRHSSHFKPTQILTMLDILAASEREIRFSNQHRWLLERTLLRLLPENHAPEVITPVAEVRPPVPTRTLPRPELPTPSPKPTPVEAKAVVVESTPPPAPVETHHFAEAISLEVVKRSWERILRAFERVSPAGLAYLQKAQVVDLQGTTVVLAFSEEFAKGRMQDNAKGRAAVEKTINQVLQTSGYTIRSIMAGEANSDSTPRPVTEPTEELALMDAPEQIQKPTAPQRIADFDVDTTSHAAPAPSPPPSAPETIPQASTFVAETLELFGGEVIQSDPL